MYDLKDSVIFLGTYNNLKKTLYYDGEKDAREAFEDAKKTLSKGETIYLTDKRGDVVEFYISNTWVPKLKMPNLTTDKPTDTPNHYMEQGVETIDIVEMILGEQGAIAFNKGNIIKYLCRMDKKHKSPVDDAKKIKRYAEMLVERLEEDKEV